MARSKRKPTGRKGGGQPGNKNALRHGFYADMWNIKTGKELAGSIIEDELSLARIKAHALAEETPLKDPDEAELRKYDRLIATLIAIGTLERIRLLAKGNGGEIGMTILEALRELNPYEEL
jgi:hypothetical protein